MPFILPFEDNPDQVQRIQIEDQVYNFRFRWNSDVSNSWFCQIGGTGADYVCKFMLRVGFNLLAPYSANEGVPDGGLYVIDSEQVWGRVGRNDLGPDKRYKLMYFSPNEVLPQ